MAAVSHAMHRYGPGPLEGTASPHHPYYIASTPQRNVYLASAELPGKSKKTWGQRLKLTKGDSSKSSSDGPIYGTVSGTSALSRSMKYAETWLYGTVRGSPAPPQVSAFPELAVLVCSCPEYLTGTKRMLKKPSVCKKCKGSRLPIGGTMRAPAPPNMMGNGTIRSGTQRPVVKVRPTILNLHSPSDPYDFMRRSRLVSPEVKENVSRSRAKSTSPNRGREARRKSLERDRSRSASRTRDCFSVPSDNAERRSILECGVNPYDLLDEDKPEGDSLQNEVFDEVTGEMRYRKAGMRGIRTRSLVEPDRNIVIAKEKVELRNKKTKSNLDISKSYSVNRKSNEDIESKRNIRLTNQSPTRPPRRIKVDSSEENESDLPKSQEQSPVQRFMNSETAQEGTDHTQQVSSTCTQELQQELQQAIKSILKKPRDGSVFGDTDTSSAASPVGGPLIVLRSQSPASIRMSPVDGRKVSSSHFYLPTPQALSSAKAARKKVQFSVENETCPDVNLPVPATSALEIPDPHDYSTILDDKKCNGQGLEMREKDDYSAADVPSGNTEGSGGGDQDFTVNSELDISSASPPKISPLRRSLSDRQDRQTSPSTSPPLFLDTTALRIKNTRSDARDIFGSSSEICEEDSNRPRPRAAPPPPPIASTISPHEDHDHDNSTLEQSMIIKTELGKNVKNIVQKFDDESVKPFLPPRQKFPFTRKMLEDLQSSTNTRVQEMTEEVKSNDDFVTKTPRKQRIKNIKVDVNKKEHSENRRSIVQISPDILNSSEVHRLQVTHESNEHDHYQTGQKKTSIMISGDDCYSTVNVSDDMPIYQSSVVVNDYQPGIANISGNTVTISVGRTPEEELTYTNNKKNHYMNGKSVIPVNSCTREVPAYASTPIVMTSAPKSGSTLVNLDYGPASTIRSQITFSEIQKQRKDEMLSNTSKTNTIEKQNPNTPTENNKDDSFKNMLMDPVEATRRNLVPHVCGKIEEPDVIRRPRSEEKPENISEPLGRSSFVSKLLEDPIFGHLAEGLENELVTKLIENSLIRLKENHESSKDSVEEGEHISKLIDTTLQTFQADRNCTRQDSQEDDMNSLSSLNDSNRNSMGSTVYESLEYDAAGLSDCYQSSASEMTAEDDTSNARNKFYQMLVDATLSEIEISSNTDDDHHYESIRIHADPIYEEIGEVPPPLPLSPPPALDDDLDKKYQSRSIFEGASKYDILSYLVDAKERGVVQEDSYAYNFNNSGDIIIEEQEEKSGNHQRSSSDLSSRVSHLSNASDSSEDITLNHVSTSISMDKLQTCRKTSAEIERNDSGVGSETSKSSRSKWQSHSVPGSVVDKCAPIHLCEDCDGAVETQVTESGVMFAPLVCRKCGKKRAERKEIITEIVETEEKYGRDLQIMLEEFYQPMLVAGLLTPEQLSAIFLNTEELLENNKELAERLRDSLEIAIEQGDEDLLTVDIGKIFVEAAPMLHAFENYCIRQGAASLLLANLEKDKELLRIFLRVSQMENTVLRRMNLNSFLMVPVQRVTKYPLLLARLYKVTPGHQEGREMLKQAQQKIELHLNHMNAEAKDIPTKLWRRISAPSNGTRRSSSEIDMINIKLRKMAVDVLEWNHDEARFAMEGKLLFTQPTDNNWRKGRTIKLTHINALLVTNGKPSQNYRGDRLDSPVSAIEASPSFPRHTGIREASLLLVKEKCGRYTLLREPLYLDRCVVCSEQDWDDYFEVQEIISKDTFIFKAEDGVRTKQWYTQLQYHAQGMGPWRKRRNALANIMINGMMTRT